MEIYSTFLNQVFLLDSQVNNPSTLQQETHGPANEEDDQRSYVFVLSSVENKEKPENAERYLALLMTERVDLLDTLTLIPVIFRATVVFSRRVCETLMTD